jgi:hypothetical protein
LGLNGRVTFRDIELVVNQDKWRPYYSLANLGIHAGVKGTTFNIGVSSKDSTYLLSGPSLLGLADPGQLTATSLHTVTRALFMCYPDLRTVITIGLFEQLVGEIYQEFGSINETLEPK